VRLLLDTCTFLWLSTGDEALSTRALDWITDPENEVFLSAVSTWEIAVKHRLGRLPLPEAPERFVPVQRAAHEIAFISLDEEPTLYEGRLPRIHRDPFDRMLICQSIVHGLSLVTPDEMIARYPVRTLW
jgi:PIN domain nuclease of toxin-antitoxin system